MATQRRLRNPKQLFWTLSHSSVRGRHCIENAFR